MQIYISLESTPMAKWLCDFLKKRGLDSSSGIPLYQYHVSEEEYLFLQKALSDSQRFGKKTQFSVAWCAVFTLFCAEWFRREYSGDWRWLPIFKMLGFELNTSQISTVVRRGLDKFWKRPLSQFGSSNNNDYLGSMFREGGLPSNLLSSESNRYKNVFFSIFERYQYAKDLGVDAIDKLIRSHINRLPETL
ncbi:MAG: STY4851/ECs_5259 family protein, partial [Enterovibrio sp.]